MSGGLCIEEQIYVATLNFDHDKDQDCVSRVSKPFYLQEQNAVVIENLEASALLA
jgi:hypothetical protein